MRRKFSVIILMFLILATLNGCYYGPQMPLNGVWKSDTPNMYVYVNMPDPFNPREHYTYERTSGEIFYQDGTNVRVDINGKFGQLMIAKYSNDISTTFEEILYEGTIKWRSKESENDTLVLIIEEGDIDGYTEIELKRVGDGVFYKEYLTQDEIYPTNALTNEYDISELKEYFESSGEKQTISEVNERFPIELTRSNGYTLYKVKEGGYYYVFWERPWSEIGDEDENNEPTVYSTLHLSEQYRDEEIFDEIEAGSSTAADVLNIDPYAEMIYQNEKLCSYSYLNAYEVLRIEYSFSGDIGEADTLTVMEKRIYDRRNAPTKLSSLLLIDIPVKPFDAAE